jgi:hypothetical protein
VTIFLDSKSLKKNAGGRVRITEKAKARTASRTERREKASEITVLERHGDKYAGKKIPLKEFVEGE